VHVGAADARVVDGDEHIVRVLQLGDGALLEADVVGLVEDEREVLGVLAGVGGGAAEPRDTHGSHFDGEARE
jgi:hypothetical protein